ncbi:hypothetical protein HZS_1831 [Henneguya salminicola]|nr:hypothetical protein HZS_1831 [Henneguya salminicola]
MCTQILTLSIILVNVQYLNRVNTPIISQVIHAQFSSLTNVKPNLLMLLKLNSLKSSKTEIEKTIQSVNKRMEELKKQRALLWQKTVAFRHSLLHGELMHKSYDIK